MSDQQLRSSKQKWIQWFGAICELHKNWAGVPANSDLLLLQQFTDNFAVSPNVVAKRKGEYIEGCRESGL